MRKNKEGSFRIIAIVFFLTMLIAINWEKWTWMKNGIHSILDPTLGAMLNWNLAIGMTIAVFLISLIITLVQKYTTDQEELKRLKKEQKEIQKKMKEFKDNPKKMSEIQKENWPLMIKQFKLGLGTIIYTGIPFVLLFRWFYDFFALIGSTKVLGMHWFLFYFIATLIFSSILKKKLDVA